MAGQPGSVFVTGEGLPLFSLGNAMLDKSPYRINEANRGKTNALERAISRGGDPITVTPVESPSAMLDDAADDAGQRGDNAGRTRAASWKSAEAIAGIFGKNVIPIIQGTQVTC